MSSRGHVLDPGTKVGIVFVWLIVSFLATFIADTLLTSVAAELVALLTVIALITLVSRTFRIVGERSDERPWWQLTSRTMSALVLGMLFGVSLVVELAVGQASPVTSAAAQVVFAGAYLASGIAQSIRTHRTDPQKE